jgi:uncharacterized protein (DUF58 family)
MLFDESTLRKLQRLALTASRVRAGVLKGERRSSKRGSSVEFADYRNYTPGDDLRRVDWNVYARLDRPFLKLFEEEEDLAVHVLVDGSKSMDWGAGDEHKFNYARRLAAALSVIALGTGDAVTLTILYAAARSAQLGPLRGERNTLPVLRFLEAQTPQGTTHLEQSLRDYSLAARRPGMAFLISDLFSPTGSPISGLAQLQNRGHDVTLLHLLAPAEIEPPLAGDLRLVDIETGHTQDVSLDSGLRELYRRRLAQWQHEMAAACRRRMIRYLPINSGEPWERVIMSELRKAGVVK